MSQPSPDAMPASGQSIGVRLRQRREALGWNVEDVSEHIRIRPFILQALEEDDYTCLPGRVYAIGFLKNYATYLGLDISEQVAAFSRNEPASLRMMQNNATRLSFVQAREPKSLPIGGLIAIGLLVAAAAYGGWYFLVRHDFPDRHISFLDRARHLSEARQSQAPVASSISPAHPVTSSTSHELSLPVRPVPVSAEGGQISGQQAIPGDAGRSSKGAGSRIVVLASPDHSDHKMSDHVVSGGHEEPVSPFLPHMGGDSAAGPLPAVGQSSENTDIAGVSLHVVHDSWVEIKDNRKAVIFSGLLKAGNQWQGGYDAAPYYITTGNAGGVYLQIGRDKTGPLGREGSVLHDLAVDEQSISSGKLSKEIQTQDVQAQNPQEQPSLSASGGLPILHDASHDRVMQ